MTDAVDDDEGNTPADIVEEARERFTRAEKTYQSTRRQAIEDTRFVFGDSDNGWQWPDEIRKQRQFDKRVCLTVNLTAQHCNQIINDIRRNRPACRIMPVDDYADKKTAEILAGLIRNIQTSSSAEDAHDVAAEHSVYGGEGFWRIITEYESPDSFNQIIKIKCCPNPQLVYIDPDCRELDKSDAMWGFIFEDINKETFKREHPDIDPTSWHPTKNNWITEDTFRRAEYFWCEFVKDKAFLLSDGSTILESKLPENVKRNGQTLISGIGEEIQIVKERDTERKVWKWCKLVGGHDEPIELTDWPGDYLPIIAIVGKEANVNGEIVRKGIVRDLKDPARMVNFSYSETVQSLALQNKVPYMAAAEAIEGYESIWGSANLENRAYLPFNAFDEDGKQLPMPSRQPAAIMPAAQVELLKLSTEEMRGASGQQNSNFGIRSEAQSGVGIQRLKQQGEIATFHFPDNLARGLRYEGKILIDLIQKVYDTKRVIRVLGLDGKQKQATLDPQHPIAYSEHDIGEEDISRIFNPSLGQYDVVIDTGPSFQTQRQEAFAALTDLAGRSPALMQVAGDIIMRAADFPMAQELADRLAKTLPPQLQDQKGGAEQQVAQLSQQAQQMQQQMQMMQQQLQETQGKLQQAESGQAKSQMEIQAKMQMAEIDAQLQEQRQQRELAAKQEQAQMDYQLKREITQLDLESKQQQAVIDAQLQEQKLQREIDAKKQAIEIESQFKREQAHIDAAMAIDKAKQDACLKMEIAKLDNDTKEDIAELNAYVELEKAKIAPPPALVEDVNNDLAEEKPLPKIMRRKVSMRAPSGGVYEGTIEDMQDQPIADNMM